MKKVILLGLTSLIFLTAFYPPFLVQLTIINKSGVELGIQLVDPQDDENIYFLTIPEGTREYPEEKTFEIPPEARYLVTVYYMETWDPVYGYPVCDGLVQRTRWTVLHNQRYTFTECNRMPRNFGEPTMRKFWSEYRWRYLYLFQFNLPPQD